MTKQKSVQDFKKRRKQLGAQMARNQRESNFLSALADALTRAWRARVGEATPTKEEDG